MRSIFKVGISVGDPNGIGLEVIIKTFAHKRMLNYCTPIIFGNVSDILNYKRVLKNQSDLYFSKISSLDKVENKKINVLECVDEKINLNLGDANAEGAKYAFKSLQVATQALKNKQIDVLVTAPLSKESIIKEGFKFVGQTEFVQEASDSKDVLMLLCCDEMKVGLVTTHIPLAEISQNISKEKVRAKLGLLEESLIKDFRKTKPVVAVLALNPHAGEGGKMGKEEQEIISPVIKEAQNNGSLVYGPYPSDSFFADDNWSKFDAILAMYHDQGLIPFKMKHFDTGVNYSAGLSVIRTSPDHGTAFNIAGKGVANEISFRNAVFQAIEIARNRTEYEALKENALGYGSKVALDNEDNK